MAVLISYIDPGSGSLLLQAVIAVVLGAAYTIKVYWKKIVAFLKQSDQTDDLPLLPCPV